MRKNPVADQECHLMLIERKRTLHTGREVNAETLSLADPLRLRKRGRVRQTLDAVPSQDQLLPALHREASRYCDAEPARASRNLCSTRTAVVASVSLGSVL